MGASAPTTASGEHVSSAPRPRSLTLATQVFAAVAVVFVVLAIVVAIVLPYGSWDAMALGIWSRVIAEHWPNLHSTQIYAADYQRPVFYWLQGTIWRLFGFHQSLGRLLSLAFSLVLVVAVAAIASRTAPQYRRFTAALAVVVVLTVSYSTSISPPG